MRRAILLLCALLLAACASDPEPEAGSSTSSSTEASATPQAPSSPTAVDDLDLAVDICTTGMTEPDELLADVIAQVQAGSSSTADLLDGVQAAAAAVRELAERSRDAELPRLTQALEGYRSALSAGGLGEVQAARQAVDLACFQPTAPAT